MGTKDQVLEKGISSVKLKLKEYANFCVTLTNKEGAAIMVSHLISLYSERLRDGKITQNQSVIDFILKNIPESLKSEISMELIDDVYLFISSHGTFINPKE